MLVHGSCLMRFPWSRVMRFLLLWPPSAAATPSAKKHYICVIPISFIPNRFYTLLMCRHCVRPPLVFIPMSFIPHVAGPMLPYTPLFLYFLSPLICSGHHSGTCQCSDQSRLASRLARHRCAATSLQEVVKFRGSDSHIDRRLFNRRPFSTKGGESPLPEAPWQPRLSALWRVEPSTSLQRGTPPRREDGLVLLPS